ncbi:hypothetical protein [Mesobacillus jeotgali]|uniref:hypothetical protein n=1 Tax=Mesobacillus jeotgali TaxID=129985 RepID=UPI001CFD0242|nr:hypothetical protein [Mesobacillus jeotgali]
MKRIFRAGVGMAVLPALIVCCGIFLFAQGAVAEMVAIQDQQLKNVNYIKSETKPDPELEEAFSTEFGIKRGEDKVRYYYNRIDLNGDEVPETFVYLIGPVVCGTGGCSGLVLEHANGGYEAISRFSLVRTPVVISEVKTNGWKDIIMYVAGGGIEPSYRVLKFNGKTYPLNPSIQPEVDSETIKGIGIISDDITKNTGIKF